MINTLSNDGKGGFFLSLHPDFDSYNLKTLIYQGRKNILFIYPTTVSLKINLRILSLEV